MYSKSDGENSKTIARCGFDEKINKYQNVNNTGRALDTKSGIHMIGESQIL